MRAVLERQVGAFLSLFRIFLLLNKNICYQQGSVDHVEVAISKAIPTTKYAETRDRTRDLQIFGLTLSQLSYRGFMQTAQGFVFRRSARMRVLLGQMLALHVEQSQKKGHAKKYSLRSTSRVRELKSAFSLGGGCAESDEMLLCHSGSQAWQACMVPLEYMCRCAHEPTRKASII